MMLATIHGNGREEYVTIQNNMFKATQYTYNDYVKLFISKNVTHVVCTLGLDGTDVGDGVHKVEDFLGAIKLYEASCAKEIAVYA